MLDPGHSVGARDDAITGVGVRALCFFDQRLTNVDGELTGSTTGVGNCWEMKVKEWCDVSDRCRLIDSRTEDTDDLNVQVLSETSSPAPRARGLRRSLVVVARSGPSPGEGHKHVEDNGIVKRKPTN
ncbi:unnamed protein product [Lactuca saligna]|uniref:Uncharacterized protein n=1 Tax=Lactuca saligna TaxID=75948 RepID=A0AA36A5Y9_LACSI|nr:unnamed protein product [Lactuca saligna]